MSTTPIFDELRDALRAETPVALATVTDGPNAGAKLLIGSYGTLGVIVEATFKLFPRPPDTTTFVLTAGTLEKARELRRAIQNSPLRPLRAVRRGPMVPR